MDIKQVGADRAIAWYLGGWRLFVSNPLNWILAALLFIAVIFAGSLIPLLGPLALTIAAPLFLAGVLEMARHAELDRGFQVMDLFAAFNAEKQRTGLLILGALVLGAAIVLGVAVSVLVLGGAGLSFLIGGDGGAGIGLGMLGASLLGFVVAICFAAAFLFAVPLVWFGSTDPISAVKTSVQAFLRNIPALIIAALIYFVGAIVASIPLGLGWLVFGPVAVGALYLSYLDILGRGVEVTS